jgi:uncharacterized protein (DUF433 family)
VDARSNPAAGDRGPAVGCVWHLDGRERLVRFERITINPNQMGGLPCVRGLRIPVTTIIGQLAAGQNPEQILADFPELEIDDIYAALAFAAEAVQERELPLVG